MTDGFEPWPAGVAGTLAVALHGWGGSRDTMKDVAAATKDAFSQAGGVDLYVPNLPYRNALSLTRASDIVIGVLKDIDTIIAERGCEYEQIVLIGHSMGGVLARRLLLVATGGTPGFRCEDAFARVRTRPWARNVRRLVTVGSFDRGWWPSERDGWWTSIAFNVMGLIGHVIPFGGLRPTIFDMRLGSPFMVQTRLHWLAFRRSRGAKDPLLVQIIGNVDDRTSPLNQVDLAVERPDYSLPSPSQRYVYLEMKGSNHEQTIQFSCGPIGADRRSLFVEALTQTPGQLMQLGRTKDPAKLVEDFPAVDATVTDAVFVMHGIRDDGFWTYRLAKRLREKGPGVCVLKAHTPTYGYFPILPFLTPWIRRQKVEWFMDQYVTARGLFPNAGVSFIGHSNGTYLAARGLRDYDDPCFKHVFFAGSVVQRNFPWKEFVDAGRLQKLHNVRAAYDWVVALLPKSVEWMRFFDLGGGGFDGFRAVGTHPSITEAVKFANGQHSAAVVETQWDNIAGFILTGSAPPETPDDDFVEKPPALLRGLAWLRIGLPLLAFVLLGIAAVLIWPLLSTVVFGHTVLPGWPSWLPAWLKADLTVPTTIGIALGLAVYAQVLKVFVTRF
jgi:pimeloyl-ACP methyl ester carboxylesterase